jgi:hypothetical protein
VRLLFIFFCFSYSVVAQDFGKIYSRKISSTEITNHILVLTSDSLEGRETGKPGQKKAAGYISGHYQNVSIEPLKNKDYYQHHSMSVRTLAGKILSAGDKNFIFYKDYFYAGKFGDTLLNFDTLLFAGYGVKSADGYNDFKKFPADNQAVLVSLLENDLKDPVNRISTDALLAQQLGEWKNRKPVILFIAVNNFYDFVDQHSGDSAFYRNLRSFSYPVVFISHEVASHLYYKNKRKNYDAAMFRIRKKHKQASIKLFAPFSLKLVKRTSELIGENIIACMRGEKFPQEAIVISAHYDHLGVKDSLIYRGADDNASGTAAVMEIARVFALAASEGYRPHRSIIFLNVSGEEKGLLGSAYYTSHPLFPLKQTIADINIDMIGRTDVHYDSLGISKYIYIIGSDISQPLFDLTEKINSSDTQLQLNFKYNNKEEPNQFYRRSDHYNFIKHNVPAIFFFSGTHTDYHKPSDTPDKINTDLLILRAHLIFQTAWKLANEGLQ